MKHVLILEDEDDIRRMTRLMLEVEGFSVIDTASSSEAEQIISRGGVAVLITDLILPERDGLQLLKELHEKYTDLRIIAISAGGQIGKETLLEAAARFGADRTLSKPFGPDEIVRLIRELTD